MHIPPSSPEPIRNSTCFFCKSQSSSWLAPFLNHVRLGAWIPGGNDLVLVEPIFKEGDGESEMAKTEAHSHKGK